MTMISAVMCTYSRFKCVERTFNCFLNQTYPYKELIIYNTDIDHPYIDDPINVTIVKDEQTTHTLKTIVVNNNIDYITGDPYTNVGAIRRDALTHAKGEYTVTWDDDDIFLPWFMQQAMDRMKETGLPSFKPERSFFCTRHKLELVKNTMEASIVADISKVREYGYLLETGSEGLGWYTKMRDNKELDENDPYFIPSYCFNWGDGQEMNAGHKQSGDINNPNNFNNHKDSSKDPVTGLLNSWPSERVLAEFKKYYDYILDNQSFSKELIDKYVTR